MASNDKKRMKSLLDCVQSKLGTTQRKSNALYSIVCAATPANLRASVVFTRLKNRRLHITVTSGGAANRMRFCQRALLEACAVLPDHPEHLSIRVAPAGTVKMAPEPALRKSSREKPVMGKRAAVGLQQAAESIDDKKLSEALMRLASRTRHH